MILWTGFFSGSAFVWWLLHFWIRSFKCFFLIGSTEYNELFPHSAVVIHIYHHYNLFCWNNTLYFLCRTASLGFVMTSVASRRRREGHFAVTRWLSADWKRFQAFVHISEECCSVPVELPWETSLAWRLASGYNHLAPVSRCVRVTSDVPHLGLGSATEWLQVHQESVGGAGCWFDRFQMDRRGQKMSIKKVLYCFI